MKQYEVISDGQSWGKFNTEDDAYLFAINHIRALKLICGDVYIPYEIVEIK